MPVLRLNRAELRERVHGCWLGKSIGGTLGGPFEGRRDILDVRGYTTPAGEPLPNDDLDLQLVWLKAVQDRGARAIRAPLLGEYWLNYIPPHWNEYGVSKANQRMGLAAPLSGMYRNDWKHSNGAWIRSEIWACLAPGCPDLAIRFAYEDACVDHGGGEGTFAAMFTAALQSAAFVVPDRDELIRIGLSKIPPDCRVARSIRIALDGHAHDRPWRQVRDRVVADSTDLGWFQAPANVAFVVIGWLYGDGDFGRSICIATNCGDDTDCTAATLGATLGILSGRRGIPAEWAEPIGDRIRTIAVDRGSFSPPATLKALTDQVMQQVPLALGAFPCAVTITDDATDLADLPEIPLDAEPAARALWERSPYATEHDLVHTRVVLDYLADPEARAGIPFGLRVTLANQMPDPRALELTWMLPEGWTVQPGPVQLVALSHTTPVREVEVEVTPAAMSQAVCRGVLQVVAQGRPTVGLIPLLFLNAG